MQPKFGYVGEKPKNVYVFPIGEKFHKGVRTLIRPTWTWQQTIQNMQKEVKTTVPVYQVADANGKPVRSYEELVDGACYILCGAGKINRSLFPTAVYKGPIGGEQVEAGSDAPRLDQIVTATGTGPTSHAPAPGTSQGTSAASREQAPFGVKKDKAKVIFVFRNGDQFDKGTRIPIISFRNLDQLMLKVSTECHTTMPCRRLVLIGEGGSATLLKSLEDIVDGGHYVALGGEKLNREQMSKYI